MEDRSKKRKVREEGREERGREGKGKGEGRGAEQRERVVDPAISSLSYVRACSEGECSMLNVVCK